MATQSYLGTQTNLTGIPSLLLSGLQNVQDPVVQTALYQIQNWANSFKVWQYGIEQGTSYTTGGIVVGFGAPYLNDVDALVATAYATATIAHVVNLNLSGVQVQLLNGSTELAAGSPYEFSFIAIGH